MTPRWPVPSLLPHGGAMVLIGEPAAYGDGWAEAAVRIGEDSLFYKAGHGVPSWVGVEYMAQTTALYLGIGARRAGRDIRIGLLIGCRQYEVEAAYFRLGSLLSIRVDETWQDGRMAVFECSIAHRGPLAKGRLNVFSPADMASVLAAERS